jgi:hypothetical protein
VRAHDEAVGSPPLDAAPSAEQELLALAEFVDALRRPEARAEREHLYALTSDTRTPDAACGICFSLRRLVTRAAVRYPTAGAYEAVCRANETKRRRIEELESELRGARGRAAPPPTEPT